MAKKEGEKKKELMDITMKMLAEVSKMTGKSEEEIMYEAIRDWCIAHGFNFGQIKSVFGVPVVSIESISLAGEMKDPVYPKMKTRVYKIEGYRDSFEDYGVTFKDIKSACRVAKIQIDSGKKAVIVSTKEGYKVLVSKEDLLFPELSGKPY
jgi:hypothetical protein